MGRGYSFELLQARLLRKDSCHKEDQPPARFTRTPLAMGRVFGLGMMLQDDEPGRHLGVDISVLAGWLDTLPPVP